MKSRTKRRDLILFALFRSQIGFCAFGSLPVPSHSSLLLSPALRSLLHSFLHSVRLFLVAFLPSRLRFPFDFRRSKSSTFQRFRLRRPITTSQIGGERVFPAFRSDLILFRLIAVVFPIVSIIVAVDLPIFCVLVVRHFLDTVPSGSAVVLAIFV